MFKIRSHKTLTALVFCFYSISSFSQIVYSSDPSSSLCFTAGLTSTKLIRDTSDLKSGILFNAGFTYNVRLSKKANIALELLYAGKGIRRTSPIIKYRYFYVEVPLYLQLKLGENIRFNIGAQYSIFSNSQVVGIDGSKPNGVNVENASSIKSNDYGFLLGAEIDITNNLAMAARYSLSGSTFFEKNQVNFGIFQLSFIYTAFRTHKQFFHHKEKTTK